MFYNSKEYFSLWCDNEDIIITYHCIAINHLTLQQKLLEDLLQYINYKPKEYFKVTFIFYFYRFEYVFRLNIISVKDCDPTKFSKESKPHYVSISVSFISHLSVL